MTIKFALPAMAGALLLAGSAGALAYVPPAPPAPPAPPSHVHVYQHRSEAMDRAQERLSKAVDALVEAATRDGVDEARVARLAREVREEAEGVRAAAKADARARVHVLAMADRPSIEEIERVRSQARLAAEEGRRAAEQARRDVEAMRPQLDAIRREADQLRRDCESGKIECRRMRVD